MAGIKDWKELQGLTKLQKLEVIKETLDVSIGGLVDFHCSQLTDKSMSTNGKVYIYKISVK